MNAEVLLPSSSGWKDGRAEPQTGAHCAPDGLSAAEPGCRE